MGLRKEEPAAVFRFNDHPRIHRGWGVRACGAALVREKDGKGLLNIGWIRTD